jgi:two-component system NarL family response regulator
MSSEVVERVSRLRILCVDDHEVVCEGIAAMMSREWDMEVVAAARSASDAIAMFLRHQPDVTIMDLQLPDRSGLEAIREIRERDCRARIVVLTMHPGEEDIYRALQAGAAAYVLKDAVFEDLVRTVRSVGRGERPLQPNVAAILAGRDLHEPLTPRETCILELMANGLRNKEIAAALGITELTCKVHLRNVFAKLGVSDRTEAVTVALRRGIIHLK